MGPPVPPDAEKVHQSRGRRRQVRYVPPTADELDFVRTNYGSEVAEVYNDNGHTICRISHSHQDTMLPGQFREFNIKIPVKKVGSHEIVEHIKTELLEDILPQLPFQFKMLLSFGSILEGVNEGGGRQIRYFYPGNENIKRDLIHVENRSKLWEQEILSDQNFNERVTEPRENSSTKFVMVTNCLVKVFSMDRPLVGDNQRAGNVPDWLRNRKCIFYADSGNDKLCVFDCLAFSMKKTNRANRVARKSQQLAKLFCEYQKRNKVQNPCSFTVLKEQGLDIMSKDILSQLETCFSINIDLYTLYSEQPYVGNQYEQRRPVLCLEHSSCNRHNTGGKINLLALNEHCVLIKDLSKLSPSYGCAYCKMTFSKKQKFQKHQENCEGGGSKYIYTSGYVQPAKTIFEQLEEFNVYIPHAERRNTHRATFDIETREIELGEHGEGEKRGEKTVFVGELKFVSFSVASNVPGYTDPYFQMNETDDKALCENLIDYLTEIKKQSARMWHEKMEVHYKTIQERIISLGGVPYIHPEQTMCLSEELKAQMEVNKTLSPQEADEHFSDQDFAPVIDTIPPPQTPLPDEEDEAMLVQIRRAIAQSRRDNPESDCANLPTVPDKYKHNYHDIGYYIYQEDLEQELDDEDIAEGQFDEDRERERMMGGDDDEMMDISGDDVDDDDDDDDDESTGSRKKYRASQRFKHVQQLKLLQWKLRKYGNLPVCGFNSSKFDLLVLREFMPELFIDAKTMLPSGRTPENSTGGVIIKKGTSYAMFETKQGLVFLDVKNYVPPGLSLAKTLQAYNCSEAKGYFPYSLLGNSEFISGSTMPEYTDYESTLKGINTLEDSWHGVVKKLYVHKWRPIVQSVIYGQLYCKGKQDKFTDEIYMKTVLQNFQYDQGWMALAEQMEPPTHITKRRKQLCSGCGNMVEMVMPTSRLCMDCYDPCQDSVSQVQEPILLSKSKDDSYLQNYTWFLEQHTCCTGDINDTSPLHTEARRLWEESSHEDRQAEKQSRAESNFVTGVENYNYVMRLWRENRWTGRDYLKWYNDLDVLPLLECVQKLCDLEWEHNEIDCMKNNVSLPNLARLKVWKYAHDGGHHFTLFGPDNAAQERKQRRCAYGGPSIVFNREQISGISRLNEGEGNQTESILGYDFNSLYPSTFLHNMPTGACFVYKPDAQGNWQFRANVQESRKQFIWLNTLNYQLGVMRDYEKKLITESGQSPHRRNVLISTERDSGCVARVGVYKPDGLRLRHQFLDWELRKYPAHIKGICYEFFGCHYHGHSCQIKPNTPEATANLMRARHSYTLKRKKDLERMGYVVRYIYECVYDDMIKTGVYRLRDFEQYDTPPYARTVLTATTRQKKLDLLKVFKEPKEVEQLLLRGDSDRPEVYGFMEVDIEDAENRNKVFPLLFAPLEMDPRYINPQHPAPDPDSREYTKEHQVLLTGVTKVIKGLYSTEYLRFLIKHGCKILKVHTVQEYTPKKCFKDLALKLSGERSLGDKAGATAEQKILALNAKITANSIYGALLMNKDHHQDVRFVENGFPVCRSVNRPTFKNAEYAGSQYTEIVSQKSRIRQNVPIQISKTVLDLAKMKISEFFYDVLDYFIEKNDYQIFQMDTDSLYFGLSKKTFEECVKPALRSEFERRKAEIFVQCLCGKKCDNPDCDKRKLNLMKLENYATHAVAITSKTHTEWVADPLHVLSKTSAKGIPSNKLPNDTLSLFYMCLRKGQRYCCSVETLQAENNVFGGRVIRKATNKTGVTGNYNHKRYLLPDQIRTVGLPFEVNAGTPKKMKGVFLDAYYDEREERVVRNVAKLTNLSANYN